MEDKGCGMGMGWGGTNGTTDAGGGAERRGVVDGMVLVESVVGGGGVGWREGDAHL